MNARTSWSARADMDTGENRRKQASSTMSMPVDDILDSRFGEDGRLDKGDRLQRQRVAGRRDPRSQMLGSEELERAVQKLAQGLETIERQSGSSRGELSRGEGDRADAAPRQSMTHSLDRLEARLEQLSRKLQQRTGAAASYEPEAELAPPPERIERVPEMRQAEERAIRRLSDEPSRADRETPEERLRLFAALESRIEQLQQGLDANQIEPIRHELIDLLRQVEEIGRSGRSVASAVDQVRAKLDDMEMRINATRNLTGNRLGDMQDRVSFLAERLGDMEGEIPGFDAVRENQSAILERFDRMEGLVQRLSPSDQIVDRVEGLKKQLQTVPQQREIVRIEESLIALAERLDRIPEDVSQAALLEGIEENLRTVAADLAATRERDEAGASEVRQRLIELHDSLQEVADTGRTPDLTGIEERLSGIASRLDVDRRFNGETLARLDKRLATLTAAVENQEGAAAAELLAGLTTKIDVLSEAFETHVPRGTRKDMESLDRKLDQLHRSFAERAELFGQPQFEPLQERIEAVQAQLEDVLAGVRASSAELGPFAQLLQDISDRVSTPDKGVDTGPILERLEAIEERLVGLSARGADPRAVHNQLENIVSRLELLKGRSIDPARLADIFDRVDSAMRNGLAEDRFDKIERLLEDRAGPASEGWLDRLEERLATLAPANYDERFNVLEQRLAEPVRGGIPAELLDRVRERLDRPQPVIPDERIARLEEKLEEIGRVRPSVEGFGAEDIGELRGDIIALRRELRSLPGLGEGEGNLAGLLKTISARLEQMPDAPAAASADLEKRLEQIAGLLEGSRSSDGALTHVQDSLHAIEERLEEFRRDPAPRLAGDAHSEIGIVADIARTLSEDVGSLKVTAQASERNTRDALEAVQETLEAVVKRMAFLERDLTTPAPHRDSRAFAGRQDDEWESDGRGTAMREPDSRISDAYSYGARSQEARQESRGAVMPPATGLPVIPTLGASLDEDFDGRPLGRDTRANAHTNSDSGDVAVGRSDTPRESGGLFSRLTSSQLLKRATGGRAESFSPETEDVDDPADQPLEPGTNTPLDSALVGAPSSDTALMSGDRHKRRGAAVIDGADGVVLANEADSSGRRQSPEPTGDDFLSAARRAAQAAAAEAAEAEREAEQLREGSAIGRLGRFVKRRRGAVLASAVAVALALAALQIVRNQMDLGPTQVASVPAAELSTPARLEAPRTAPAPLTQPATPEPVEAAPEPETPPAAAELTPLPSAAAADAEPAEVTTAEVPTALPEPTPPPAAAPPVAEPEPAPPVSTAALAPPDSDPSLPSAGNIAPDLDQIPAAIPPAVPAVPAAAVPSDLPEALGPERLRQAATSGDPVASFEVASRYAEGRGVAEDMTAAIAWYNRAASAGLAPAQYRLGSIYEKGLGAPKDLVAAQDWYGRAADAGNVKAMHNLAVLYAEGAGGAPDLERAAALFRKAADHGVRDSQFNLAILHARGLGVPQDMMEAYKWFAVAAGSGDQESAKRRDIIASSLNADDLAKAEAAAASFQPLPLDTQANDVVPPEGGWGQEAGLIQSETDLIALVQGLLAEKGYDPGPADGVLGTKTVDAIRSFQESAGLEPTGEIDTSLVTALQEKQSI